VDIEIYRKRRDLMADVLTNAGIEFMLPKGAFYFFAKSPVEDERVFVEALLQEHVLAVPGRGFGLPGYIRLAFCVEDSTIINSRDAFKRAVDSLAK
jgi:aspartate aminotransferase